MDFQHSDSKKRLKYEAHVKSSKALHTQGSLISFLDCNIPKCSIRHKTDNFSRSQETLWVIGRTCWLSVRTRKLQTNKNERHGYNKSEKVSSQGLIVLPVPLCKELQSFVDVVLAQSLVEKRRNLSFISMHSHFPWAIQTRRFGEETKWYTIWSTS